MQMSGRGTPAREKPLCRQPPGTGRRPALSLTGADPPDAAASPAGAGWGWGRVDTQSEAGQPAAARIGRAWATTRGGPKIPEQRLLQQPNGQAFQLQGNFQ